MVEMSSTQSLPYCGWVAKGLEIIPDPSASEVPMRLVASEICKLKGSQLPLETTGLVPCPLRLGCCNP